MLRTLIVDDELYACEELETLLEEVGGFEIQALCDNPLEAIRIINRERPDVLFLDVQMPVLDGFELLGMIDEDILPYVVFVTAYDEFALKAFEENALDYLLKPVHQKRLAKTVAKIEKSLRAERTPSLRSSQITRIPCTLRGKVKLIDPGEVAFVQSVPSGVHVVCPEGEFYTDLTLKVLEARTGLLRCHKQYLVNVEQIDEIDFLDNGIAELKVRSGAILPVSRHYLRNLRDAFGI
jgi:two-component system LytT family response regulator